MFLKRLKELVIGGAKSPRDTTIFHRLSLIAFFAWVGLGADGLSSACYGPSEAFKVLGQYPHLALFVALGTAVTVFIIAASYSQIVELFPSGGGGYLVASKLLSPSVGMVSGCALLIDYVLTISTSIASGADQLLNLPFLPPWLHECKMALVIGGVLVLTILNMRGVRESVTPLVPIFVVFVLTHFFAIGYTLFSHVGELPSLATDTAGDIHAAVGTAANPSIGLAGMLVLMLHAYSQGAGTYTGIEAVSNGMPMLREPRVRTAKRTMQYMAWSLAFMAAGLMVMFVLLHVSGAEAEKTNALSFLKMAEGWGTSGSAFVIVALVSEAAILFVAAQAGFMDGPRVLANMAIDRWLPTRFAMLSDRLVTQNGVLLMGLAALLTLIGTQGKVEVLLILYAINVFITFILSQLGMVRHWWIERGKEAHWKKSLALNGMGLVLCVGILISTVVVKFTEGGWVTLVITGVLVLTSALIHRHYTNTHRILHRLDALVQAAESGAMTTAKPDAPEPQFDPKSKTAVLMVSGFNGLGLHSLFSIMRLFGDTFRNFVFVQVGAIDAGNFKGTQEVEHLTAHVRHELDRYVAFVQRSGYYADSFSSVGVDVIDEIATLGQKILERYPQAVFFGGQLVFPQDTLLTRFLHNYVVFTLQRRFYQFGVPFVILPIRVTA